MAYRRRQGITRVSTYKEETTNNISNDSVKETINLSSSPLLSPTAASPSLAAQAIRASAAHRESSLSSAYGESAFVRNSDRVRSESSGPYADSSMTNESKYGFWGVLARKAKAILDDDNETQQLESSRRTRPQRLDTSNAGQFHQPYQQNEKVTKVETPRFRKGLDALTSSMNQIGDTFEKAFEEGRTIVENKTADIIQETRKLQIRRKGNNSNVQDQTNWQQPMHPVMQTSPETQLKASRDVAMATAAKAKLLLRELKTVKADLAFAKERCSQLEEENKILRENRVKGNNPADDDLIRLQLETLLAEKARIAHENSIYARENRFLREIVEYHQLTMQDVVYLDEGSEEVTEVYPIAVPGISRMLSGSPLSPQPPHSVSEFPSSVSPTVHLQEFFPPGSEITSPGSNVPVGEGSDRRSTSL